MNRNASQYSPDRKLRPSTRFGAMILAMLAVAGGVTPLVTTQVQAQTNNGVTVTPSTLAFDEGTNDSYTVVLDTQPESDVIIDVTPSFYSSSPSTVSISETMLTFTADDWDSPQSVTITALEDSDTRDLRFDINHQVSGYPGVTQVQTVEVEVYDDDEAKIRLSNPRPKVDEGGSATYTVWLNTRPDYAEIGMSLYAERDEITVHPTILQFTNENWRTPQTVTITAAHDQDAIDNVSNIVHTIGWVYASGEHGYAKVTAIDDEKSRLVTHPTSLTIEAGETERYAVWIEDLPYVNDVTVTITSNNPAVTVDPSTLTFTRATWGWFKAVDVTGLAGRATLTHTMSGYNPVKTLSVNVTGGTRTTTTTTTPVTTTTPDLEMGTVVVSDENLSSGSHFTLSTSVTNEGDGDSEATTIRFYRSTDSTITSSDTQQSSSPVIPLAAQGQEVTAISVSLTAPSEEGTYYYGACVDSVTGETDTADNCSASVTVTVTVTVTVNRPATGAPTISGTAQVGQTLTTSTSAITDPDGLTNVSYSYQWLADHTEIGGATNSTYTPQTTDIGKVIKVRVTFTDDRDNNESLTSAGTVTVTVNRPATGAPTISGTAQVGQTLTTSTSAITDPDGLTNVSYSYQWLADDTEIGGATNSTYTPQTTDIGKVIKVRVTFTDDRDNNESLTSAGTVTVTVNRPATGAPTISGTAQVGQTLTTSTSAITDPDGLTNVSYSYQWLADDTEIGGATNSTYTPQTTDIGKVIKVRVTFTDDRDNNESLTSAGTVTVTVNRPATGTPTISGTAQVGQTLTTSTSAITDPDGLTNVSYSYQWLADHTEIGGATNSTYTPQTTDIGKVIKVRVTFTDDRDNNESLTSAAYPGSGTIIAATTKRPVGPVAPTQVTTDPATDDDADDNDADADSDTDTDTEDGDESQGGENRIDCDDLETQTPFVDVLESSPEAQAIACIYALGITTGTSPTTYSPGADVSRAQMASFLARLYKATTGTDAPVADTPFTDVETTSSAYNDIGRIYGLGITTGTTPTTYSPGANVNRAQMASFLARLYKATTGTDAPVADTPFTDVETTSSAYNDIGRIYGLGITTGTTPTTYSPGANVNRAQMASFLARLYKATTGTETP